MVIKRRLLPLAVHTLTRRTRFGTAPWTRLTGAPDGYVLRPTLPPCILRTAIAEACSYTTACSTNGMLCSCPIRIPSASCEAHSSQCIDLILHPIGRGVHGVVCKGV